jgi:hypothetical protein
MLREKFVFVFTPKVKEKKKMDHTFYDVKNKKSVTTKVIECVTYTKGSRTSYAFKGKTEDGRNLTAFVKKEVWDKANK